MRTIITFLLFHFFCVTIGYGQVDWPAITQEAKPWARWWWQGSAVNKGDLLKNLDDYKAVGLGGLEITPIYGVRGMEHQFIPFLSAQWMDILAFTLVEAKKRGLGIDMANGTGWPFGGPWIKDQHASKTIFHKEWRLKGGETITEPVVFEQRSFVRTANTQKVDADTLLQDIASNKNLQALALDQVQFSRRLPVLLLMAYPESGLAVDLTKNVDAQGILNWKAPAGNWQLVALFEGLHGKMVERAAPGGEGYAIDHFSADALDHYLARFDSALKGRDLSYVRAFFNDSYEVDDARGQSNWTNGLLTAFKERRGYALEQYLPALLQLDAAEKNRRVLYDYRVTIDEMILENFTRKWKSWGAAKDKKIRNQSHGSPANLLDLYGAIDIPETEGNDILRFKFATSAAHVMGKRLASAEAATWLNEHFLSNWGDVKNALDLFMLAGVNHIFYHGVNYSPKDAPWPGWLFYAAVHFNGANPQWKDFETLNNYVARCQSMLQQGQPDNDVLLYFPIVDRYMEPGNVMLQHFDGMERNFEGTDFARTAAWLQEAGHQFDFISDRQIASSNFAAGIQTGGQNRYKTIIVAASQFIAETTFQKLMELAEAGANIIFYKGLPLDVPGFHQLDKRRAAFKNALHQIKLEQSTKHPINVAKIGKGSFIVGIDLAALLEQTVIIPEPAVKKGLHLVRRKHETGSTYMFNNRGTKRLSGWVPLNIAASEVKSIALFDPMGGDKGLAQIKKTASGLVEVYLQLEPNQTCFVQTYNIELKGATFPYRFTAGNKVEITGTWNLTFESGGPTLPKPTKMERLQSWAHSGAKEREHFSGTVRYTISFPKPKGNTLAWWLDLGHVDETATVFLNGKRLATLITAPFRVEVSEKELQPTNRLEVVVANLMANRIRHMDRTGIQWKNFYNINMSAKNRANLKNGVFDASGWEPQSSGLLGPVTLTPITHNFPH